MASSASCMDDITYLHISDRVENILQQRCNQSCADCAAPHPQWASLLLKGQDSVEGLGVVICEPCAVQHHHQLGEQRAFIKYLAYFHEWTHPELDLLEYCGNDLVNKVYEANLIAQLGERSLHHREANKQGKFIKKKYGKCRYKNEQAMEKALTLTELRAGRAKLDGKRCARRGSNPSNQSDANEDEVSSCNGSLNISTSTTELDEFQFEPGSRRRSLLDEEDDFFLACAKTEMTSQASDTDSCSEDEEDATQSVADASSVVTGSRPARRNDELPRKPMRRVSNDHGDSDFITPTPPIRKSRMPTRTASPLPTSRELLLEPEETAVKPSQRTRCVSPGPAARSKIAPQAA